MVDKVEPVRGKTDAQASGGHQFESIHATISAETFEKWYRERQFRKNIRDGKPYFNGPSAVPPPEKHSPSSLLQCQRKVTYRQENAPEEQRDAEGILWVGSQIEDQIILPFLQDVVATEETYVRNSIWVDFTVETRTGDIRMKGVTDPVIVTEEGVPLVATEIKSSGAVKNKDRPLAHHRAQLHAYLFGLSDKYEIEVPDGMIIYISRETFEFKSFDVEFDREFWEQTVIEWAESHTEYRLDGALPPASPEQNWECKYCSYRERCGEGSLGYSDEPPEGLLPDFGAYPRQKVIEYLEGHDGALLPPQIAEQFPTLASEHGVAFWECPRCESKCKSKDLPNPQGRPLCPQCASDGTAIELYVPVGSQEGS